MVWQCYDGASVMSSCVNGVQMRIREKAPLATYVDYAWHVLNLELNPWNNAPEIWNMYGTVKSVTNFINESAKRREIVPRTHLVKMVVDHWWHCVTLHLLSGTMHFCCSQSRIPLHSKHSMALLYNVEIWRQLIVRRERVELRLDSNDLLVIPRTKPITASRAFRIDAPKGWNSFPATVRSSDSTNGFRRQLKTHLFDLAYNWP